MAARVKALAMANEDVPRMSKGAVEVLRVAAERFIASSAAVAAAEAKRCKDQALTREHLRLAVGTDAAAGWLRPHITAALAATEGGAATSSSSSSSSSSSLSGAAPKASK